MVDIKTIEDEIEDIEEELCSMVSNPAPSDEACN